MKAVKDAPISFTVNSGMPWRRTLSWWFHIISPQTVLFWHEMDTWLFTKIHHINDIQLWRLNFQTYLPISWAWTCDWKWHPWPIKRHQILCADLLHSMVLLLGGCPCSPLWAMEPRQTKGCHVPASCLLHCTRINQPLTFRPLCCLGSVPPQFSAPMHKNVYDGQNVMTPEWPFHWFCQGHALPAFRSVRPNVARNMHA
jgi:hypothetical protein